MSMTTKRVTVIEREYNEKGDLVKETETITEYDTSNKYPASPWTNPPFNPPYVSYL